MITEAGYLPDEVVVEKLIAFTKGKVVRVKIPTDGYGLYVEDERAARFENTAINLEAVVEGQIQSGEQGGDEDDDDKENGDKTTK